MKILVACKIKKPAFDADTTAIQEVDDAPGYSLPGYFEYAM
jgi:hypothetical protein